jgi:hypothetical protein
MGGEEVEAADRAAGSSGCRDFRVPGLKVTA